MIKYITAGTIAFFLWCLATLLGNAIRQLSELGNLAEAEQLILPMWLFTIAYAIMLIVMLAWLFQDLRESND